MKEGGTDIVTIEKTALANPASAKRAAEDQELCAFDFHK